jgi:DNA repair exonuclease SbcCD nuclease subunit
MKIVCITDTHFGARNDSQIFNEFFYDFYSKQFFPYILENINDICGIVHLGDCLDRRKFVNYRIAKDFRERFIGGLKDTWLPVHFIVGNHDIYYKNTLEVNCYKELGIPDESKSWYVHDKPELASFEGYDIAMIPWITSETYADTMRFVKESGTQIAMGHLEIKGFEMHSGIVSDQGMDKTLFNNFDIVMSGHYHKKSTDGHITYLGCPYEMTWADAGDPKGFHTFDVETRELEFIPNERTLFKKIHYNDKETDYNLVDISQYDKKFVKVFVENRDNYYAYDKFLDRLYKDISVHDLKIVEDFSDLSSDFVHDDIINQAQDTLSLLGRYVEEIETTLDKGRIKSKLKSLYIGAGELEV